MEMVCLETDLTEKEVKEFNEACNIRGICPAQKIGEIVHGFILAEGVKHLLQQKVA